MPSILSDFKANAKCAAICASLGAATFQYGCDSGIIGGFQATPGFLHVFGVKSKTGTYVLQTTFQQLISSLLVVGFVAASALIGPLSTVFGRRSLFTMGTLLSYIAITTQILVVSKGPIYAGRFIMGLANGLYINTFMLYSSEASPAYLRGAMVSMEQGFVALGALIGAIISNAFHTNAGKDSYQIQLYILYVMPTWILLVTWFIPESPRWLAVQGMDDKARRSLRRLRGSDVSDGKLDTELLEIVDAIRVEKELASSASFLDMWRGLDLRRTLLSIACNTAGHVATGISVINSYGTFLYQVAGVSDPFTASVITHTVNVFTAYSCIYLAVRFGRRQIFLGGLSITTPAMFAAAILGTVGHKSAKTGNALIALLTIYLGAFSGAIGPMGWTMAGEIPSNRLRSMTQGVGSFTSGFFEWLVVYTTPFFINTTALDWGAKVLWLWAASGCFVIVFVFFFVPETKGRSLEDLDELFYLRVPPRQFKDYDLTKVERKYVKEHGTTLDTGKGDCSVSDAGET